MRIDATTIDEFLDALDDRRRADVEAIDELITSIAPEQPRRLFVGPSITMLGYGEMAWERPSGSGVWPVIGLASQKRHISLYVAAERDGVSIAEYYDGRLGATNNGKGCIRFGRLASVDADELANAVRDSFEWADAQERRFGRNCAQPVDDS